MSDKREFVSLADDQPIVALEPIREADGCRVIHVITLKEGKLTRIGKIWSLSNDLLFCDVGSPYAGDDPAPIGNA